ncbi:MAG: tRNA preQ1(34) S-adenosylmethionine ribosyltransferase-isomerase QueA [Desulfobulbaceae bacterium]|jgi:S-adenosylmethionine:tRNA ribosyltransferase-isomerase|nr:tRNA preQ1(34) S-adenosylmethionine ribosyltransferase-isomerase QueA [Desulfobulbaceae bacterium]MDH3866146.1 tRNA preQ1(34) S-adenosylmethionine ribosyltransferase-isomerase QueA [Desulfobulbaceae bacterium]MDH3922711.1 tRNA preQ1(34) S-adenosylmethionine ribosyltransferase-isomerase QueA [Desulfobulbaceae bacterium]MDH3996423.1 tRNA preQ1(34) S-adenosylmethionine ribosyltransferase-isomerase QueA [Desulfobulbaceae bacterium]HKJ13508.1 tRNA preQ1(34) S-adenosylmethionine ribosyltransferase
MNSDFNIEAYQYELPPHQIAQFPTEKREQSRLLVLDCPHELLQDMKFSDILDFFSPGDLLVVNDTKVFPARLEGRKDTGGKAELFLLEYPDFNKSDTVHKPAGPSHAGKVQCITVTGLIKSSKKLKPGSRLFFNHDLEAELLQFLVDGKVQVRLYFHLGSGQNPEDILLSCGRIPLPPYIRRNDKDHPEDRKRYQTLFAQKPGAVAAPTAGLHFSKSLLRKLQENNIRIAPITLHVGYGTFSPVRVKDIRQHKIHEEYVEIRSETAELINQTRESGKRVWAVGTTTARTLEFAAAETGEIEATQGWCGLYIYPGYRFKIVNGLITNFHLPGSSLLFLVAALTGRSRILRAYNKAIRLGYRFYSYGDAMLIIC